MEDIIYRRKGEKGKIIKMGDSIINVLVKSKALEGIIVEMEPGSEMRASAHSGEEIRIVLEGEIEVDIRGDKYILKAGDMLWFSSILPHKVRNPSKDKKAVYFLVNVHPSATAE